MATDEITTSVSPAEIAEVSKLTEKHVRRMIRRAEGCGPWVSPLWFGCRMEVLRTAAGLKVRLASLPPHIREAFVMLDQLELPLCPDGVGGAEHDKLERLSAVRGHAHARQKTDR